MLLFFSNDELVDRCERTYAALRAERVSRSRLDLGVK